MEEQPSKCCMYFVKRKNRYCRMTVKRGNKFCGEHQQDSLNSNDIDSTEKSDKRIRCPLDPTQYVSVVVMSPAITWNNLFLYKSSVICKNL